MNKEETLNTIENLISMYDKSCSSGWYIQELEKVYKYVLDESVKETEEEIEVKALSPAGMTAEDMCEIVERNYPKSFEYWYKFSDLIWKSKYTPNKEVTVEEENFWENDELNFARSIVYDFGKDFANKVGKILVATTE